MLTVECADVEQSRCRKFRVRSRLPGIDDKRGVANAHLKRQGAIAGGGNHLVSRDAGMPVSGINVGRPLAKRMKPDCGACRILLDVPVRFKSPQRAPH